MTFGGILRAAATVCAAIAVSGLPLHSGFAAEPKVVQDGLAQDSLAQHGLAMHGELKYPPDFTHFDYVNPNAPKGGAVRRSAIGGFDSFNPYIVRGRAAAGIGLIYEFRIRFAGGTDGDAAGSVLGQFYPAQGCALA